MRLNSISAKETVRQIQSGKLFLPPIQRDFVWRYDRITMLFDSLYKGYPINNFIFWKLEPNTAKIYPLHQFTKSYSEKIYQKKEPAPRHLLENEVWAVVDGQQRLSSLYIGLAGVYKYKKGKGRNIESNLVSSCLYFNLFETLKADGEESLFKFLSGDDASFINDKQLWFEVGAILSWSNLTKQVENHITKVEEKVVKCGKKTALTKFIAHKEEIKMKLSRLYLMVNEDAINYLEISEQNIDEVVEMFTRINAGGIVLKKSELLFSTLVALWPEGKEEIDNMIESLNDSGIPVSKDFIMRCCIVLSDLPVKYRLESFNKKNIGRIKSNWDSIKVALNRLIELLPSIGYNYQMGISENALIPIAYYIKIGGSINNQKAKTNLQLYYAISQINGIFGGHGDQVLEKMRTEIKEQRNYSNTLDFQRLKNLRLPAGKSFSLTTDELDELINSVNYWSPHAYFLLSLVYPNIDFKIHRLQLDHIHPRSKFNRTNLINNRIEDDEVIDEWIDEKRDLLPNLQLLDGVDNNNKKSKTIIDYLKSKPLNDRKQFIRENLLPSWHRKELLELSNFELFLEWRSKEILRKLKTTLKVYN